MRTEREMLNLIQTFAQQDERVRAVIMNGSRVNSDVSRDVFQDYDVVYIVTSVDDFVQDRGWIKKFGELIIMQTPDENALFPSAKVSFAFLMLFEDGNRIDLTLYPVDHLENYRPESLSLLLLDKDHRLGELPAPSNHDYRTVPPTFSEFSSCCNEFWWVSTYVAKGLWRRELPYARLMLECPVRDMLTLMLKWYVGTQTDFRSDPGKFGKYFERVLEPRQWKAYVRTFADAEYEHMWEALFAMGELFREIATEVANHFGYQYRADEDERVWDYLQRIHVLPQEAKDIP